MRVNVVESIKSSTSICYLQSYFELCGHCSIFIGDNTDWSAKNWSGRCSDFRLQWSFKNFSTDLSSVYVVRFLFSFPLLLLHNFLLRPIGEPVVKTCYKFFSDRTRVMVEVLYLLLVKEDIKIDVHTIAPAVNGSYPLICYFGRYTRKHLLVPDNDKSIHTPGRTIRFCDLKGPPVSRSSRLKICKSILDGNFKPSRIMNDFTDCVSLIVIGSIFKSATPGTGIKAKLKSGEE